MKKNLICVLLALVLVLGLMVISAPNAYATEESTETAAHSHCVCVNAEAKPADHVCEENVTWVDLSTVSGNSYTDGGHYYLTKNLAKGVTVSSEIEITICLNGYNLYAGCPIIVYGGGTINICNCQSAGRVYSSSRTKGSAVLISNNDSGIGTVNLWSGNISGAANNSTKVRGVEVKGGVFNMYGGQVINGATNTDSINDSKLGYGGNVCVYNDSGNIAKFNMYGGTVTGGQASVNGGNIYVEGGKFTMTGGVVTGGKNTGAPTDDAPLTGMGGNIFATSTGSIAVVTIEGGTVQNGTAANGGNIACDGQNVSGGATKRVDLNIKGGTISAGEATVAGGNLYLHNTTSGVKVTMTDGTITGGKAVNGGNIAADGANPTTLTGGTISDGEASENGGNVYVMAGNTFTLGGVTVSGGTAGMSVEEVTGEDTTATTETTQVVTYDGLGGSIYVDKDGELTITAGTVTGGKASAGGNIYALGAVNISNGIISNGVATGAGGNIRVQNTGSSLTMTGGTVVGGEAASNGGNVYTLNCPNTKITGGEITDGKAISGHGGNIYITHSSLIATRKAVVQDVVVTGGQAGTYGGNIYIAKTGSVTVQDVTAKNGSAVSGDNVYLTGNLNVDISGGEFTAAYGGRNYVYDADKHSKYTQEQIEAYGLNYVGGDAEKTGNGGNICVNDCGKITATDETTGETTVTAGYVNITGSTIIGGQAENGGAIYVAGGAVTLDGVTAKSCGGSSGKVMHIATTGTATVKDSTLVNWGINGSTIVNQGTLTLAGNINMPREYNANEMLIGEYSATVDILVKCDSNASAVMEIAELVSVDSDVVNVENVVYGDGVLAMNRSEKIGKDDTVLNTAGLLANGAADTHSDLFTAYNSGFGVSVADGGLYLVDAAIQGITETGNVTCGGANLTDITANNKDSVVYYKVNEDVADAGILGVDIYLNLNGKTVAGATVSEGVTLYLMDTANDSYDATKCGSFSGTVEGTVEAVVHKSFWTTSTQSRHYVVLPNEDGSYSAHRYMARISHYSLDPANDALGYKAEFSADAVAQAAITGYGFEMWVNDGAHKTYTVTGTFGDDVKTKNLTLRLKNIMAADGGEMTINANAFITFNVNGETAKAETSKNSMTMKYVVELAEKAVEADSNAYTEEQMVALQSFVSKFVSKMEGWDIDSIQAWQNSEYTEEVESGETVTG